MGKTLEEIKNGIKLYLKRTEILLIVVIFFALLTSYFLEHLEPTFEITVTIPKQYQKGFILPTDSNVTDIDLDVQLVPSPIFSNYNDYQLNAYCKNFELYPQSNKVVLDSNKFLFNRGMDSNLLLLKIDSQEQFGINNVEVSSSQSNNKIIQSTGVQDLIISSEILGVGFESKTPAYLFTEKITSVGNNVNVDGVTELELRLPSNDFQLIFDVSKNAKLKIDKESINLLSDSKIKTNFSSNANKAIFFKRDLNIQTSFSSLSTTRIGEPVILKLDDCVGNLSISNPPIKYELYGSGSVYVETMYADLNIKNGNKFGVESGGNAKNILINGLEPWKYQLVSEFFRGTLGIIVSIIGISLTAIPLILRLIRTNIRNQKFQMNKADEKWREIQAGFWPLMVMLISIFIVTDMNDIETLHSKISNIVGVFAMFLSIYIAIWALLLEDRRKKQEINENEFYKVNITDKMTHLFTYVNSIYKFKEGLPVNLNEREKLREKILDELEENSMLVIKNCDEIGILNLNSHVPAKIKDQVYTITVQARKAVSNVLTWEDIVRHSVVAYDMWLRMDKLHASQYMLEVEHIREKFANDILINPERE